MTDDYRNFDGPVPDFKGSPMSSTMKLSIIGGIVFVILIIFILAIIFRKKEEAFFYKILHSKNNTQNYDKVCTEDKDCLSERLVCDSTKKVCRITPGYVCVDSKFDCGNSTNCLDQGTKEKACMATGDNLGELGFYSSEGICKSGLKLDTNDHICKADIGTACLGGNNDCINKFCNAGFCSLFSPLQPCTEKSQCKSGNCTGGQCRTNTIKFGDNGADCNEQNTCTTGLLCINNICGPQSTTFNTCSKDSDCTGPTGSHSCNNTICVGITTGCNDPGKNCPSDFICTNNNCVKNGTICDKAMTCPNNSSCDKTIKTLFKMNNIGGLDFYCNTGIPKNSSILNMISCNIKNVEYTYILYTDFTDNKNKLIRITGNNVSSIMFPNEIVTISISYNYFFAFTQLSSPQNDDKKIAYGNCTLYYINLAADNSASNSVVLQVPRDYHWVANEGVFTCNSTVLDSECHRDYNLDNTLISADVLFCKHNGYNYRTDPGNITDSAPLHAAVDGNHDLESGLIYTTTSEFKNNGDNIFVVIVLLTKTPSAIANDTSALKTVRGNMLSFARVGLKGDSFVPFTAWQYRYDSERFGIHNYRQNERVFTYNGELGEYNKCKIIPPATANDLLGESSFTDFLPVMLYGKDNLILNTRLFYMRIQPKISYTGNSDGESDHKLYWSQAFRNFQLNIPYIIPDNSAQVTSLEFNRSKHNFGVSQDNKTDKSVKNAFIMKNSLGKYILKISDVLPVINKTTFIISNYLNNVKPFDQINFGSETTPQVSVDYNNNIFILNDGVCIP